MRHGQTPFAKELQDKDRRTRLIRDLTDDARFVYAHVWNVPPHDPALDNLSGAELELYSLGRLELMDIMTGKKNPGPSSAFLDEAKRRMEQARQQREQEQSEPVTPEELGWTVGGKEG